MVGPTKVKPRWRRVLEIFSDSGLLGGTGPSRGDGLAIDEVPGETGEVRARLAHRHIRLRIADARLDLAAGADDPGIGQQALDLAIPVRGNLVRIEAVEGPAETVAAGEDRAPGQPGLEAVEDQFLPELAAVALGHAPFAIVVIAHEFIGVAPGAADAAIGHPAKPR